MQATLLKAWISQDSYQNGTNLHAWLFTILRNTFISDLRTYRHESQDIDGYSAGTQTVEPNQVHALALNELVGAIPLLPEGQRRALILMGAFGYSQLEVADACGCTIGTVKSRVSRGRAALVRILDYDGISAGSQSASNM